MIHLIAVLSIMFVGFTLINRVLEGAMVAGADIAVFNNLTIFREISVFGMFTLPVPNMSFITEGIPRLITWDYSFFGGNAGIMQYFMYALTAAVSFMLFTLIIGLLYQYFGRAH